MTETLTNLAIHTATNVINRSFSSGTLTWDLAVFMWDQGAGGWDNPFAITNVAIHSATNVINRAFTNP